MAIFGSTPGSIYSYTEIFKEFKKHIKFNTCRGKSPNRNIWGLLIKDFHWRMRKQLLMREEFVFITASSGLKNNSRSDLVRKTIEYSFIILLMAVIAFEAGRINNLSIPVFALPSSKKTIVIDAGHGGWDPGKVNETGEPVQEKDINLQIAEKLQFFLEQSGAYVVVTRADDSALGDTKRQDLKNRFSTANDYKGDIFISIHQNSYPESYVKGAQVFYYETSEQGKNLAQLIQAQIKEFAAPENTRDAKPNMDYYLLKNADMPTVLVECGFLTNSGERKALQTDEYQTKIAWSIFSGVVKYFEQKQSVPVI